MEFATGGNRLLGAEVRAASVIDAPPAPPTVPRWRVLLPRLLVVGCVLAGLGLRASALARNQSLWLDEAMLALNVIHRTPAGLLRPLDWNQGAPVGFLLASKLLVEWLGNTETVLRLPAFVSGLIGFALFVPLAYRLLPVGAGRIAVCLFALSPYLIGYCAEFKQYELDAALAVALTVLAVPVWRGTAGSGRLVAFALAGAVAVWFSHPAVFVLGGVGLACLSDAVARRDRSAFLARLAVVAAWVVSFAACYLLVLRNLGRSDYLLTYWAGKFLPLPPTSPGDLAWVAHHFTLFFEKPGGLNHSEFGAGGLAATLFLVGCIALTRSDWRALVALVVPLLLALLASGLKMYPFAGRLLLYAVPAALVVVAAGAHFAAQRLGRAAPGAGLAVLAMLFLSPVAECNWHRKKPIHAEDCREALAHVHARWQPSDKLFLTYGAVPGFLYYSPRFPFPADAVSFGEDPRETHPKQYQDGLRPLRGEGRVWVVMAHRAVSEEHAVPAYLDGIGRCDERAAFTDAVAMRYDLSR